MDIGFGAIGAQLAPMLIKVIFYLVAFSILAAGIVITLFLLLIKKYKVKISVLTKVIYSILLGVLTAYITFKVLLAY